MKKKRMNNITIDVIGAIVAKAMNKKLTIMASANEYISEINIYDENDHRINFQINTNNEEAVGLSRQINEYLGDDMISIRTRLAVEEILTNIIKLNDSNGTIDVYLKDTDEEIIVSIKDDGIEYNPIVEIESLENELEFDNITVLNKIADKIDYARVLGLNNTVITIKKQGKHLNSLLHPSFFVQI